MLLVVCDSCFDSGLHIRPVVAFMFLHKGQNSGPLIRVVRRYAGATNRGRGQFNMGTNLDRQRDGISASR